jgi:hypothetical protein
MMNYCRPRACGRLLWSYQDAVVGVLLELVRNWKASTRLRFYYSLCLLSHVFLLNQVRRLLHQPQKLVNI